MRTPALAFVCSCACTSAAPTQAPATPTSTASTSSPKADPPQEPAFSLGFMYWAPETYVLGGDYVLVVGGEVVEVHDEAADNPELRGPTIAHATIAVEHVFADTPPQPRDGGTTPRYAGQRRVTFDGADGLAKGDRVIVFAESYDGGYGIAPKRGTGVHVGLRVQSWSDPIVPALVRYLGGKADLRAPADADAWRPFGEAAVTCVLDGVPPLHCGME